MKKFIIMVSAFIAGVCCVNADVYNDIITQIEENNASLKALRYGNISEMAELQMENNLSETEVEFEHVWASRGGEKKWNAGISQSFDFPGAYAARKRELAARREAFDLKYKAELTNVVLRAHELLIEIAYCNKAIALEEAIVEDMKSISGMLAVAYEGGDATILEVNRSKIELANNMVKLNELIERKNSCESELVSLGCSVFDMGAISYPIETLGSIDDYYMQIDKDPFVAYYQQQKRAEALGEKSRKMEMLPGLKVGYVHEYEDGTSFNGFSVGLSLPIFSNRGKKALSKALAAQADWNETAARVERRSVVDVEYRRAESKKQLVYLLGPVFYNNKHTDLLLKAYKGGQMSAIDYLREVTYFRESEWDFLQVELDYHLALARLNVFNFL